MYTWKSVGQIFNPTLFKDGIDRPWMKSHAQCPSSLIFEDFIRIFFSCRPERDDLGRYVSHTSYIDFTKDFQKIIKVSDHPIMGLGDLGSFDEHGVYPTSVIRRFNQVLMYYSGWSWCTTVPYTCSIGMALSYDNGNTFLRLGPGPVLSRSLNEPYDVGGPKVRCFNGAWFLYYIAGDGWKNVKGRVDPHYRIRLALMNEKGEWVREDRNIIGSHLPEPECQAGPDVFYKDGRFHMYFSYRYAYDFRDNDRGYRIGYAYSYDGIDWTRNDSLVSVPIIGGFNNQMSHYPHVFEVDGKWYMLLNGNDFGRYGIGLYVMEE